MIARAAPGMLAGVRAEDIALSDREGIPATVLAKEYLGADTILRCKVGTEEILVRAGRVACRPRSAIRPGFPGRPMRCICSMAKVGVVWARKLEGLPDVT